MSVASVPLAVLWVGASPRMLDGAGGPRAAAAALAALERPVFAALVTLALLAAIHGVPCKYTLDLVFGLTFPSEHIIGCKVMSHVFHS